MEEVFKIFTGEFIPKWEQKENYLYPVYNGAISFTGKYFKFNQLPNKITISSRGSVGVVNIVREAFWAGNSVFSLCLKEENDLTLDFYYFSMLNKFLKNNKILNSSAIPSLLYSEVAKFKIYDCDVRERTMISCFLKLIADAISLLRRKRNIIKLIFKKLCNLLLN
ncbi:restriction endonuclease subunit S [Ureaplasma miroungigenitalium]|uniref:restriction endonuclease subunit S n=1 Tax=Ureaplasma miroungigenitalium TaxID=1042321 RepID=UPI0021E7043F|nr:restriction endonuclease subunit S [Ureaplasma miroungigenitalium]MCV3734552.1 restriction endonuclease subunit S [Ureaplasma miroungigenitalium]